MLEPVKTLVRRRGSVTKRARARSTERPEATRVARSRPGVMARVTPPGSPASMASVRSVWTIRVQTVAKTKATRSGGKKTLSVRFAASTTWKRARVTSRNSVCRGRVSISCSPWVRAAKWARAMVEGSPRRATVIVAATIPNMPRLSAIGLLCQKKGRSRRHREPMMAAT
jgi:hypothetical protein